MPLGATPLLTVALVLFPEAAAPALASTTDMADAHTERCMGVPRVPVVDSTDVECRGQH